MAFTEDQWRKMEAAMRQQKAMRAAAARAGERATGNSAPASGSVLLGYDKSRDCTVVAFRDRLGAVAWLRDENTDLVPVAKGAIGSAGRDAIEQRYARVDAIFRSME